MYSGKLQERKILANSTLKQHFLKKKNFGEFNKPSSSYVFLDTTGNWQIKLEANHLRKYYLLHAT